LAPLRGLVFVAALSWAVLSLVATQVNVGYDWLD